MGRRNQHSQEEFKALVMSTTRDMLASTTVASLSLRKIAKAIGYAPSMLLSVYQSFNHLLLHVNADTLSELVTYLSAPTQVSSADAQLIELGHRYIDYAQANPYVWRLVFELHLYDDDDLPQWVSTHINALFVLLESLLKQVNPDKSPDELTLASRVLWSGVHGITALSLDDKLFLSDAAHNKQLVTSLVTHYLSSWQQ